MNYSKQNNFAWNAQKPVDWYFPTFQNNTNMNFNSNLTLKPTMDPIKYNTNSIIPNVSTWKPITNSPNNTLTIDTNQTNLDPIEDMDWSYYEPSYYQRNCMSYKNFK